MVERGWDQPAEIRRALIEASSSGMLPAIVPTLPTVRSIVGELLVPDSGDGDTTEWSLIDSEGEDARVVLGVLSFVIPFTDGRVSRVSRREAKYVVALKKCAELHPLMTWLFAREYVRRERKGEPVHDIDVALAFGFGGLSERDSETYATAIAQGWIDAPALGEGTTFSEAIALARQRGGPRWLANLDLGRRERAPSSGGRTVGGSRKSRRTKGESVGSAPSTRRRKRKRAAS